MPSRAHDLFEATTGTFWETMNSHNGSVGYRVPLYQRPYDWGDAHLTRLLEDCLLGFHRHSTASSDDYAYTYLGSIILTSMPSEATYDGYSLDIIDGQQRLTSLVLMSCALFSAIHAQRSSIHSLPQSTQAWLQDEVEEQLNGLYQCAIGTFRRLGKDFPYPRIVRSQDIRAKTFAESDYLSPIATFLSLFSNGIPETGSLPVKSSSATSLAEENVQRASDYVVSFFERYLVGITPGEGYDSGDEDVISVVPRDAFERSNCRSLFQALQKHKERDRNRHLSAISSNVDSEGLIRLLLFASYLLQNVLLTRVETQSEDDAFDIFDALNTTGEPLTALETCKPHVTRFEQGLHGYVGSETEEYWDSMEASIFRTFPDPESRQKEVKDLVTSFALYLTGEKQSSDLVSQRKYMRDQFTEATKGDKEGAMHFVKALDEVARFRIECWSEPGQATKDFARWTPEEADSLRLCLSFIADTGTTLAIPILTRYWVANADRQSGREFLEATRAVAAFLALRRAATSGTAGIDSCFRDIMSGNQEANRAPLCWGPQLKQGVLPVDDLRQAFREMLAATKDGVADKDAWVSTARDTGWGRTPPSALCRFLILAASNQARPEPDAPGTLTRESVIAGSETAFLEYTTWASDKYRTVEHIAPQAKPDTGWDARIYANSETRHMLGNLVLLPESENKSIGNAGWEKKKIFYSVLASRSEDERADLLALAKENDIVFGRKARQIFQNQEHLNLLDQLTDVEVWTKKVIEERTENLLQLAWDELSPWLF